MKKSNPNGILWRPQYLLWDLDGTLLHHRWSLKLAFVKLAWPILRQKFSVQNSLKILLNLGKVYQFPEKLRLQGFHYNSSQTNEERLGSFLANIPQMDPSFTQNKTEEKVIDWFREELDAQFETLKQQFVPFSEAKLMFKKYQHDFQHVLATNPVWSESCLLKRVQWAGFSAEEFVFLSHAQNMHACKPALAYYQEILQKLRVEPQECLMIGNDSFKDGPAAVLGIPTFILKGNDGKWKASNKDSRLLKAPVFRGTLEDLEILLKNPGRIYAHPRDHRS